jgi:TetR/AcrR family transcriptional repressor of bet genes
MATSRRTQAERTDQTRAALVRAAATVVARRGFAEATLNEIARAAGVSRGALAYHYHAREDLLPELVAHCVDALERAARQAADDAPRPAARLRAVVRALRDAHRAPARPEAAALLELLALARRDPTLRPTVHAALSRVESGLDAVLRRAAEEAGLRARAPLPVISRLALALFDGLGLRPAQPDDPCPGDALDDAAEALLLGLFGP